MKADLSIVITNYDKPKEWVDEAVESVKAQTIPPKEIILVDDRSKEPIIHLDCISIVLPKNEGVAHARDVGVRQSTGRLLVFLDGDDKLSPDFIERCGEQIDKADIVYTDFIITGAVERPKLERTPQKLTPEHLMSSKCPIRVTSMMHRKVYEDVGGFKELEVFEDWDFYLRAMCNGWTFARANTYFEYRKTNKGRIACPTSLKETIHKKISAPYKIINNKLCLKD